MNMNRVYKKIAKKYGVSVAEVEREIRSAVDIAYKNPNSAALGIKREGNTPTPEEFISCIAQMAQA